MMFFKNQIKQNGFMLLELIIAVSLLGIGSIAIMNLQVNTLDHVIKAKNHLSRLFKLQNLFFDPELQKNIKTDDGPMGVLESQTSPDFTTVKYEILPLSKKSDLSRFANVYLVQAVGSWAGFNREYDDSLISLIYLAPKESKENSKPEKMA